MNELYKKVIDVVREAKKLVVNPDLYKDTNMKGEADFVTAADLAVSKFVAEELAKLTPEIGFMSEEDAVQDHAPTRWILDPIDGTTNVVYDYKMSTISLALLKDGEIVFGVVYNPYNDETFWAVKGEGAYLGDKRIFSIDREPKDGLVEFGSGSTRKFEAHEIFVLAESIYTEVLDFRRICSSALSICYIAAGRMNGYFEKVLKPWDYAAAHLILSEAGGVLCDWQGKPLQFDVPTTIIAGTPKMAKLLCEKLAK